MPTYVVSDYWDERGTHRPYRNVLHGSKKDEPVSDNDALEKAIEAAGAVDGDEIEIIVRKTGRRPFGNRKFRWARPHEYEREKKR